MRDRAARVSLLLCAALLVSFLVGQGVIIGSDAGLVDADGHLVRAANVYMRLRTGDVRLTDQLGTPSWGVPELEAIADRAPYPGGYNLIWLPALAVSGGDTIGLRAFSVLLTAGGIVAAGLLAAELAGAWAAVVTVAALVGMPVVMAMAASCTIDTALFPLTLLAAWILVRGDGFRRPGSGWWFGVVAAFGLTVRWTIGPLLLPLAVVVAAGVARPGARGLVAVLVGAGVASAAALGAVAGGAWEPAATHPVLPWLMSALPVAVAAAVGWRARGDVALRGLATAFGWVLGPGTLWYWIHGEGVAFYLASQQRQATPETTLGALAGLWSVLGQLGTGFVVLAPLGLLAAVRVRRPREAVALVATGLLAGFGLLRSGSPEIFTTGSIGARLLLGPAVFLALGVGFLAVAAGRRAVWVAVPLVGLSLFTQWSFRLPLCAPKQRDHAIYRVCAGSGPLLSWSLGNPQPGPALRVEAVLPWSPTPRVVAVLTPNRRLWRADELPYVAALIQRHQAVTVVELQPVEVEPWVAAWRHRVDDVVTVGLPPLVVGPTAAPAIGLDLGTRAPRAFLTPVSRSGEIQTSPATTSFP